MATASAQLNAPAVLFAMKSDPFCALPISESVKLELLDGRVVALPWPSTRHQHATMKLGAQLSIWTEQQDLGRLLPDTLVKLNDQWTVAPDLSFIDRRHLGRVKESRIEGPVDLAVEVLSPSHPEIDREAKFAAYARFGIRWYWIVDLTERVLEEYELVGATYGKPVEVPFDDAFEPRLFPGLTIDLASLEWK